MYKAPKFEITKEILLLISKIDEVRGYWNCFKKYCNTDELLPLQNTIKTSISAVSDVLKYEEETDMTGYLMALNWIFADYEAIILSEKTIDKIYRMIENLPPDAEIQKSCSIPKAADNECSCAIFGGINLYEDSDGSTENSKLPEYTLEDVLEWAGQELLGRKLHPLFITCIVAAELLKLKVYPRANSRLSRILTMLIMLKSGYSYLPNFSLDMTIKEEYGLYETVYESAMDDEEELEFEFWNTVYLKILQKHALNLLEKTEDITPVIKEEPKTTEKRLQKPAGKYTDLPELQIKIVKLLEKSDRITISEVAKTTKTNINTVKKHLASMTENKIIEKHGKTRGAWYSLA